MLFKKITDGYVVQTFNDAGEFLNQKFVACEVTYETDDGDEINVMNMPLGGREYHPFDMLPNIAIRKASEQIQEDLSCILDGLSDTMISAVCQSVVDNLKDFY